MSCKVKHCRFPHAHTTKGHLCGTCKKYGHGQIECGNQTKMDELKQYWQETLDPSVHCGIDGCLKKETHNSKSHNCEKCYKNHSTTECIIQSIEELNRRYPITKDYDYKTILAHIVLNDHLLINGGYIETEPFAMGCKVFIKCDYDSNHMLVVSGLFMHPDCWGQYGPSADDRGVLNLFLGGCENITEQFNNYINNKEILCPLCRTINKMEDILPLLGNSDICSVCLEQNVEVYFKKCSHTAVCRECYKGIQ